MGGGERVDVPRPNEEVIRGHITKVIQCNGMDLREPLKDNDRWRELYVEFQRVDRKKPLRVHGTFPIISRHFLYSVTVWRENGWAKDTRACKPETIKVKRRELLTHQRLEDMLVEEADKSRAEARRIVATAPRPTGNTRHDDETLCAWTKDKEWRYIKGARDKERLQFFRYEYIARLLHYYKKPVIDALIGKPAEILWHLICNDPIHLCFYQALDRYFERNGYPEGIPRAYTSAFPVQQLTFAMYERACAEHPEAARRDTDVKHEAIRIFSKELYHGARDQGSTQSDLTRQHWNSELKRDALLLLSAKLGATVLCDQTGRSMPITAATLNDWPRPRYLMTANDYNDQRLISERISDMIRRFSTDDMEPLNEHMTEGIVLSPLQRRAVDTARRHPLLCMTGGPGTGKTTTCREIVRALGGGDNFLAVSFTGKAALNLGERVDAPAFTIHRMLWKLRHEINHSNSEKKQLEKVPFFTRPYLLVDEATTVEQPLFAELLELLPSLEKMIFVGDINQLPAIGPGAVFKDCLERYEGVCDYVVRLDFVYRVGGSAADTLNSVAKAVLEDEPDDLFALAAHPSNRNAPFVVLPHAELQVQRSSAVKNTEVLPKNPAMRRAVQELLRRYPDPMQRRTQFVTFLRMNVNAINTVVGASLFPGVRRRPRQHFPGEKMMFTQNNPGGDMILDPHLLPKKTPKKPQTEEPEEYTGRKLIMAPTANGEFVWLKRVYDLHVYPKDLEEQHYDDTFQVRARKRPGTTMAPIRVITFEDQKHQISPDFEKPYSYKMAYACTVHKMMGSENDTIIVFVERNTSARHHRGILYTAITRARCRVVLCGDREDIERVMAQPPPVRRSLLQKWLPDPHPSAVRLQKTK